METEFFACAAVLGGLLLIEAERFARRRRRATINGMLKGSQPCAVRRR